MPTPIEYTCFQKIWISKYQLDNLLAGKSRSVESLLINCLYVNTVTQFKGRYATWGLPFLSGSIDWVKNHIKTLRGNERDIYGCTPAHYAALSGNKAFLNIVLKTFPELLNLKDNAGRTIAHYVVWSGHNVLARNLYNSHPQLFDAIAHHTSFKHLAELSGNHRTASWLESVPNADESIQILNGRFRSQYPKCAESANKLKEVYLDVALQMRSKVFLMRALKHTKRNYLSIFAVDELTRFQNRMQTILAQEEFNRILAQWYSRFAAAGVSSYLVSEAMRLMPKDGSLEVILNNCSRFKSFGVQYSEVWQLMMLCQNDEWRSKFRNDGIGKPRSSREFNVWNSKDNGGRLCVHYVAWVGDIQYLKYLSEQYRSTENENDNIVFIKDKQQQTAMEYAILGKQTACVEFLLRAFPQFRSTTTKELAIANGIDYVKLISQYRRDEIPNYIATALHSEDTWKVQNALIALKILANENYANAKEAYVHVLGHYLQRLELSLRFEDNNINNVRNILRNLAHSGIDEATSLLKKAFDAKLNYQPGFFNVVSESTATNSVATADTGFKNR